MATQGPHKMEARSCALGEEALKGSKRGQRSSAFTFPLLLSASAQSSDAFWRSGHVLMDHRAAHLRPYTPKHDQGNRSDPLPSEIYCGVCATPRSQGVAERSTQRTGQAASAFKLSNSFTPASELSGLDVASSPKRSRCLKAPLKAHTISPEKLQGGRGEKPHWTFQLTKWPNVSTSETVLSAFLNVNILLPKQLA